MPYGVIVKHDDGFSQRIEKVISIYIDSIGASVHLNTSRSLGFPIEEIKPYLRPMSSMTEEEWKEFDWFVKQESDELFRFRNTLKFYNKNYIDYNGLIPMGLAIEITEDNNPYKN